MIHIKRFIDKMTYLEGKNPKDVVLPISDARGLRDDISKLLIDLHESKKIHNKEEVIKIDVKGGSFK
jgi:hypothetical protein